MIFMSENSFGWSFLLKFAKWIHNEIEMKEEEEEVEKKTTTKMYPGTRTPLLNKYSNIRTNWCVYVVYDLTLKYFVDFIEQDHVGLACWSVVSLFFSALFCAYFFASFCWIIFFTFCFHFRSSLFIQYILFNEFVLNALFSVPMGLNSNSCSFCVVNTSVKLWPKWMN